MGNETALFSLTDISEIQSLASDHSGRSHDRPARHSRSRSPDQRSEPSDHSRHSPQQPSNGSLRSREEERVLKPGTVSTPVKHAEDHTPKTAEEVTAERSEKQAPSLPGERCSGGPGRVSRRWAHCSPTAACGRASAFGSSVLLTGGRSAWIRRQS